MRSGFMRGITTGSVIGAAIGMIMLPQLDRNTRNKIRRSVRMVKDIASDVYEQMMNRNR